MTLLATDGSPYNCAHLELLSQTENQFTSCSYMYVHVSKPSCHQRTIWSTLSYHMGFRCLTQAVSCGRLSLPAEPFVPALHLAVYDKNYYKGYRERDCGEVKYPLPHILLWHILRLLRTADLYGWAQAASEKPFLGDNSIPCISKQQRQAEPFHQRSAAPKKLFAWAETARLTPGLATGWIHGLLRDCLCM